MFELVISTCNRRENYIKKTLESIGDNDVPLTFVVSGTDSCYLNEFISGRSNVNIITNDELDSNITNKRAISLKAGWNYVKCLSYKPDADNILFIEDDVVFCKNWQRHLENEIGVLKSAHPGGFILSLYTASKFKYITCGQTSVNYPTGQFFGLQGMYFSPNFRKQCRDYLDVNVKKTGTIHDTLLQELFVTLHPPLYVTIPCLVNHIGQNSTWFNLFNNFHSAVSFKES